MDTFGQNFEIRSIPLSIKSYKNKVEKFLNDNDLRLDEVDYYAGVFLVGEDDVLLGGGGLQGNVIKCIAIADDLRETGMGTKLISHLYLQAINNGEDTVRVFTKPENKEIFTSLGFKLLATSDKVILLENGNGLKHYCDYLASLRREGENGAIVMNANPFTLGHRYLIETAAKEINNLYIIVVKENRSLFSYDDRKRMITKGTEDLKNVIICEGSDYQISNTTFPTYFLKEITDATDTQISLDLDLFSKHIAPALNIKKRFIGTEPKDVLTNRYNYLIKSILPEKCIEVVEVDRLQNESNVIISATTVRECLSSFDFYDAKQLVYPTTIPFLLSYLAVQSIKAELDTTPKPGLVDKADNGAHSDMDYNLMLKSIYSLHPYFTELSCLAYNEDVINIDKIKTIGIEAEKQMLFTTNGVNTYKGALFSMGLVLYAASYLCRQNDKIQEQELQKTIKLLSIKFSQPDDTHGKKVIEKHNIKGALNSAIDGYTLLFDEWLPFYRKHRNEEYSLIKLLLFIMTNLDDTNIYYRKGEEVVAHVKQQAQEILDDFSIDRVEKLNREFVKENISPGGAADMLSLTLFIDSIIL